MKNFAYIDSQNVHRGIEALGWKIDWFKFYKYLSEKYKVTTAYLFIGYVPEHNDMYDMFQEAGFVVKFKPTLPDGDGNVKGNCDADLVLQTMIDYYGKKFDKAVIVSSDGDFYSLARFLYDNKKLEKVMSPHKDTCSKLLRKTAKERIIYMDNLEKKIGLKNKETKKKSTA